MNTDRTVCVRATDERRRFRHSLVGGLEPSTTRLVLRWGMTHAVMLFAAGLVGITTGCGGAVAPSEFVGVPDASSDDAMGESEARAHDAGQACVRDEDCDPVPTDRCAPRWLCGYRTFGCVNPVKTCVPTQSECRLPPNRQVCTCDGRSIENDYFWGTASPVPIAAEGRCATDAGIGD